METTSRSCFEVFQNLRDAKVMLVSLLAQISSPSSLGRNRSHRVFKDKAQASSTGFAYYVTNLKKGVRHMKFLPRKKALFIGVIALLGLGLTSAQAVTTTSLSEKNALKTVIVKLGSKVELSLHSMYWQLAVPAKSSSLTSKGAPILKPIFPGPSAPAGCRIAGSGCGTQTWVFTATKIGITHLVATRTTCGEAMKCTGANGRFVVTVKAIR